MLRLPYMNIQEQIKEDMKVAMRAKEAIAVTTLRGVMSSFTNELVAKGKMPQDALSDEEALAVIKRESKKRKDSIDQFGKAGRNDLVEAEQVELAILEKYLPELLTQEQIRPVVEAKMKDLGITEMTDLGKLMGSVMQELGTKADGNDVRAVAQALLTSV